MPIDFVLIGLFLVQPPAREPIIGGPCDGCEAVFDGLPDVLTSAARIAPAGEPGEAMVLAGTVSAASGAPAAGVVVYAYHTDARGIYPQRGEGQGAVRQHGRLRGWARTDDAGRYRFDTIRPASYPGRRIPAHVHLHVIEPGRATYYIDDVVFDDDPLLDAAARRQHQDGRGGSGLTQPVRDAASVWQVRRDIHLGERVPGYPR